MKKILLLLIGLSTLSSNLCARIWTNTQGQSFEGDIIEFDSKTAKIKRSTDQRVFSISINDLSEPDREYINGASQEKIQEIESASNQYQIDKLFIKLEDPQSKKENIRLYVKYNNKTIWEGTTEAPGTAELLINVATDFDEEPPKGRARNSPIYLYIESDNYATQWHMLEKSGNQLNFRNDSRIKLYRKKYVIIEYEYYKGDDNDFSGREPTYKGIAAIGHWGSLPGFNSDWQIWQGSVHGGLWGGGNFTRTPSRK